VKDRGFEIYSDIPQINIIFLAFKLLQLLPHFFFVIFPFFSNLLFNSPVPNENGNYHSIIPFDNMWHDWL